MTKNASGNTDSSVQNAFQGNLVAHVDALPISWRQAFADQGVESVLESIDAFLARRLAEGAVIFPRRPLRALLEIAPEDVQVVVIGQDPYHGPNQAQGLAFSVPNACRTPPSLRNMFAELAREFPQTFVPQHNSLVRWARQGALMLNTSLTVEAHQPASHARCGWQAVTDAILLHVLRQPRPKVFLLWGAHAQAKEALVQSHAPQGPVLVLKANHPSPLSATRPPVPFMGCGHFATANEWLRQHGQTGIEWLDNRVPGEPSSELADADSNGLPPAQGNLSL
ncbi:uracil-DNA glycosylase [Alcaligenaceae bacterium]|nr:uracil-DNA glycosylase [Alcaligenaceae bacterium]